MKAAYLISPLFLLFGACGGGTHIIPDTPPEPNPTPVPDVTDFYVSPSCSDCRMEVRAEKSGGMESILGSGYDITGDYISPSALRGKVVDISLLQGDALTIVSAPATSSGDRFTGADAAGFLSSLMANVDGSPSTRAGKYFTGTLNSPSSASTYILNIAWTRKWIGGFPSLYSTFRQALSPEFLNDISYMRASAIVEKYGTHFISHASVGVAVKTLYSTYVDSQSSDKVFMANKGMSAAEAALAGKLGPDLALTLAGLNNYGATLTKTFCGGEPDMLEYDPKTGLLGESEGWSQAVDYYNCSLVSLSRQDLTPITAAIEDPVLRSEMEQAIERHILAAQKAADATVPLLQNTDGRTYRYVTGYEASLRLEDEEGLKSYGVLGAMYQSPEENTLPLYTRVMPDGSQVLSLLQPTYDWTCIGYVLPSRTESSVSLYEITDGSRYAYTIEAANSYGPNNQWHPTGMVFHLLRP